MLGQKGGYTNLIVYCIASALAIIYVAPFQVDGTNSVTALLIKTVPLLFLAYCMHLQQSIFKVPKNKLSKERIHLAAWCKWAFVFASIGDFLLVSTYSCLSPRGCRSIETAGLQPHQYSLIVIIKIHIVSEI